MNHTKILFACLLVITACDSESSTNDSTPPISKCEKELKLLMQEYDKGIITGNEYKKLKKEIQLNCEGDIDKKKKPSNPPKNNTDTIIPLPPVKEPGNTSNQKKFNQLMDDCKGFSDLPLAEKIVYELKPVKDALKTEAIKLDTYHQLCKKVYLQLLDLDITSNKIKICNFRKIVESELENSNFPVEENDIKAFNNKCEASNN